RLPRRRRRPLHRNGNLLVHRLTPNYLRSIDNQQLFQLRDFLHQRDDCRVIGRRHPLVVLAGEPLARRLEPIVQFTGREAPEALGVIVAEGCVFDAQRLPVPPRLAFRGERLASGSLVGNADCSASPTAAMTTGRLAMPIMSPASSSVVPL